MHIEKYICENCGVITECDNWDLVIKREKQCPECAGVKELSIDTIRRINHRAELLGKFVNNLLPNKYDKWYIANTTLSLIPIGKVSGITTKNLFYPLNNEELTIGYRTGSSNHVTEDGIVSIVHEKGDLLLMECWD